MGYERTFTPAVGRAILAGLLLVLGVKLVQMLGVDRCRSRLLCRCAGLAECRHGEELGGQGPLMERADVNKGPKAGHAASFCLSVHLPAFIIPRSYPLCLLNHQSPLLISSSLSTLQSLSSFLPQHLSPSRLQLNFSPSPKPLISSVSSTISTGSSTQIQYQIRIHNLQQSFHLIHMQTHLPTYPHRPLAGV